MKMSMKKRIRIFESVLHSLHFSRSVAMNDARTIKTLDLISDWSMSHRDGNGEISETERQKRIDMALEKLDNSIHGKENV